MAGDLDTGSWQLPVESNKQLADPEQQDDAAWEMDGEDDSFNRWDFTLLMISIAILAVAIWWVTPW